MQQGPLTKLCGELDGENLATVRRIIRVVRKHGREEALREALSAAKLAARDQTNRDAKDGANAALRSIQKLVIYEDAS